MKILYVSQYFPPEMGAPAARAAELSWHWMQMGHEITVLTGFPNHPTGIVPEEWRSRFRRFHWVEIREGIRVVRTWLWPLPNRKWHERIRTYVTFFISSAISGLALPKPDVIIATSPQLLVALTGWWLSYWKRVPFVFEVRDLWPESLAAVGVSKEGSLLHSSLQVIARFLYRRADRIVVVSTAFKSHLVRHWRVPAHKILVVENGVETDVFRLDPAASDTRKQLHLEDRFVICYIGTMGNAHGLKTLIAAAEALRAELPQAMFLMIGEGAEKDRIVQLAAEQGLTNIRFLPQQSRELIPAYISAADLCLVLLKKNELFKTVIPTKLLEYMACERPVIVAVDGQARQIVEAAGAGLFVEPEDSEALAKVISQLAACPEERKQMGKHGRHFIVNNFSREKTAQKYIAVLQELGFSEGNRDRRRAG